MNEIDEADFEMYLEAMRPSCTRCGQKFEGASWSGRCYACHNETLRPYVSGEDYIGIGRD